MQQSDAKSLPQPHLSSTNEGAPALIVVIAVSRASTHSRKVCARLPQCNSIHVQIKGMDFIITFMFISLLFVHCNTLHELEVNVGGGAILPSHFTHPQLCTPLKS